MKSFFRVFLFLLAFQLEVRVKASATEAVIETPEHCLATEKHCVLKVYANVYHWPEKSAQWYSPKNTVLEHQEAKVWKLHNGDLWVHASKGLTVESSFGNAQAQQGEYWVSVEKDKTYFRNISSDIEVTLRDGRKIPVPAGFQFWVSGLNSQGQSEYGMVEPIDMKKILPIWSQIFPGAKADFITKMRGLREEWGNLVEVSSELYRDQTLRKIASVEEQKRAEVQKREDARKARERLREVYRARVFDR